MKVEDKDMRPIWVNPDDDAIVNVIDQRRLPHELTVMDLKTVDETIYAIKEMVVRGAPLIGATGAYGVYLSTLTTGKDSLTELEKDCQKLKDARPTAVNLAWAVDRVFDEIKTLDDPKKRLDVARKLADIITEEEAENCRKKIGRAHV